MNNISVFSNQQKLGELFYEKSNHTYGFNYSNTQTPVSLTMPCRLSTYEWKNRLHPIFDMNMPEGYLFEILKNHLSKQHGYIDDFLIFSYLAGNIQSRLSYKSNLTNKAFTNVDINDILQNDSQDSFTKLVKRYLGKNAISGVQPKTLALIYDKESLTTKEYIIKTWGEEFPQLAENEYFCLKAVERAGVPIPAIQLSKNKCFLLVERFNYNKQTNDFLGFEEILGLLGKNKEQKYDGSYEQIAKIIYSVTTNKNQSMMYFYKTVVMSFLLKNGDAHLKNFGVLYNADFSQIYFSPAYDVVNTAVYFYKDRPALTLLGKKLWFGKKELKQFGIQHCQLSKSQTEQYYTDCLQALKTSITQLNNYLINNPSFNAVGSKMLDSWRYSLKQTTHKELPDEIIRNWPPN